MEQLERIARMERALEEGAAAVTGLQAALEQYLAALPSMQALTAYYQSEQWMQDYEAEEQGKLPQDMKRGVVSQDAIWDLLCEQARVLEKLRALSKEE